MCNDGSSVVYGWAKNAKSMEMPKDVSLTLNPKELEYMVLQIHYKYKSDREDWTSLELLLGNKTTYDANIMLIGSGGGTIPPHTKSTTFESNCEVNTVIHPFAFRPHGHDLAKSITGFWYNNASGKVEKIANGNPQLPQAFYPVPKKFTVNPGDVVHARCDYDSTNKSTPTEFGSTHNDEMCNLYLYFYAEKASPMTCWGLGRPDIVPLLPEDS